MFKLRVLLQRTWAFKTQLKIGYTVTTPDTHRCELVLVLEPTETYINMIDNECL